MADKPILFSAPMVRALLDGRKTQTRRVIKKVRNDNNLLLRKASKNRLGISAHVIDAPKHGLLPFSVGDRLWVRETWRPHELPFSLWDIDVSYAADGERRRIYDGEFGERDWTWPKAANRGNVSPLFMPRWASRLMLTVTQVRVQRLHDMSREDCIAEGCAGGHDSIPGYGFSATPKEHFHHLWDSINGAGAWDENPWVAAYTFTVQRGNIDQVAV